MMVLVPVLRFSRISQIFFDFSHAKFATKHACLKANFFGLISVEALSRSSLGSNKLKYELWIKGIG